MTIINKNDDITNLSHKELVKQKRSIIDKMDSITEMQEMKNPSKMLELHFQLCDIYDKIESIS